jgi:DNA-binding ferritin-like protein (Dps family)
MKFKAPPHDYQVGYRRVSSGMIYHATMKQTTVQKIMENIVELEHVEFETEILYIVKID